MKKKKLLSEDELLMVSGGVLPKELNDDSCFQLFGANEKNKKDCERKKGCRWGDEVGAFNPGEGYCVSQ